MHTLYTPNQPKMIHTILLSNRVQRKKKNAGRKMKRALYLFLVFLPFAFFYKFLEKYVGDTWFTVIIFCVVLFILRFLLFLFRQSKNIKDDYLGD